MTSKVLSILICFTMCFSTCTYAADVDLLAEQYENISSVENDDIMTNSSVSSDATTPPDSEVSSDAAICTENVDEVSLATASVIEESIYSLDFENNSYDENYVGIGISSGAGSYEVSDGKLRLKRSSNGNTEVNFYATADHSQVSGAYYLEIDMERSAAGRVLTRSQDGSGKWGLNLTSIDWHANGNIYYNNAGKDLSYDASDSKNKLKLGIHLDTDSKLYSLWINGTSVAEKLSLSKEDVAGFKYIRIYMEGSDYLTLSIASFELYKAKPISLPDEAVVEYDKGKLTKDSIMTTPLAEGTYLIDSLVLPVKGAKGSQISWQSTAPDVISTNGTVTRHLTETRDVSLTATVTSGTVSESVSFDFCVAPLKSTYASMPELMGAAISNDFVYDYYDGALIFADVAAGSVNVSDGKLNLIRSASSGNSSLEFRLTPVKSDITSKLYMEFVMSRSSEKMIFTRCYDSGYHCISGIDWLADGKVRYNNGTEDILAEGVYTQKLKLAIMVDSEADTYSLYLNNALVASDLPARADIVNGFYEMMIYTNGSNYTTLSFESYRIYNVWSDMADAQRVALDAESLTFDKMLTADELSPSVIDCNLSLPRGGANGSTIVWQSSDEGVVSTDGVFVKPEGDSLREITLTATVTYGDSQRTKNFSFSVPEADLNIETTPTVRNMICNYEFNDGDNPSVGKDGTDYESVFGIVDGKYSVTRLGDLRSASKITVRHSKYGGDDSRLTGVIGVEFELERDQAKPVQVQICGVSDQIFTDFVWYAAGDVSIGGRDTPDGAYKYARSAGSYTDRLKVKFLLDCNRSMYTVWFNDELVNFEKYSRILGVGCYASTRIYNEKDNFFTFTLDNFKVYEAIPPTLLRLDYDMAFLTEKSILTSSPFTSNYIDSPLNLYKVMNFGSIISWESSRPDVIDPESGLIYPPDPDEEDVPVTVTAHVSNSGIYREKSFDFVVIRNMETTEDKERGDYDFLNESILSSENPDHITRALNLMDKGIYGSDISWHSSNENYIAPSGRVTRPKWDEADAEVVLTATVAGKYTKQFAFTVKADEKLTDPQRTTDSDFFGVYGAGGWTTKPMLNYEYNGMEKVGEAAKQGDYSKAKEELFSYMKSRQRKVLVGLGGRNPLWSDSLVAGMADMQAEAYQGGRATVSSNEYEKITVEIASPGISGPSSKSYGIISKYNDTTEVTIAGTAFENESMRPVLNLMVNGSLRTYKAKSAATVRTGEYITTPYGRNDELKVKMFGDFLGDETYRTYIEFEFDDILLTDTIGKAYLEFYAKKSNNYSEPKDIWILKDPNTGWDEKTLCWNDLQTYLHNYNGLPGGKDWKNVRGSNVEYYYQSNRFYGYREIMREYLYTQNKDYAYTIVRDMMDFINDCNYVHPRTLDTGVRMEAWIGLFDYVMQLPYTDADVCTAIIKTMYKDMLGLNGSSAADNWAQTEKYYTYCGALLFPELADSEEIKQFVIDFYTNAITVDYYDDGTYIEDTAGYHFGAIERYMEMKEKIYATGGEVGEIYDKILHNAAYFNLMMRGPAGEAIGYGDSAPGKGSTEQRYLDISNWYNDYELMYIDTYGASGIEPSWTSRHFPDSKYTFMRSDWSKTASYLFTNVFGCNDGHGHKDDNAIILYAYGRNLLADAGFVDYDANKDRSDGVSTLMHNTVTINDENQVSPYNYTLKDVNVGDVHSWTANTDYDFLSQSTKGYSHINNNHRRSITFIKPGIWIVSDLCEPEDKLKQNNYKQTWHMVPAANLSADTENAVIKSGFSSGGNILIANADRDAETKTDYGVYTSGYGNPSRPLYGYYEKNSAGDVSFDTVLVAYEGTRATVDVERIELEVPTSQATAIKFTTNASGEKITSHYLLNYTPNGKMTFGDYGTNGMVTVVSEDEYGSLRCIKLNGGNTVTDSDGNVILDTGKSVTDISIDINGDTLSVSSSDTTLDANLIKVIADIGISYVTVNGDYKRFEIKDGVIELTSEDGVGNIVSDNNANLGIKDKDSGSSGGAGGSGGEGGSGGGSVDGEISGGDGLGGAGSALSFTDISAHWAKDYITDAHSRGFVNGYEDLTYRPDNNITRAEFATLICRAFDIDAAEYDGTFADVSASDWYAGYVSGALGAGIISKDTNFRPSDNITREEMCKILAVAMQLDGYADDIDATMLVFTDSDKISDWAADYVRFASYHGVMTGRADGSFDPKDNATRAEAATVLSRIKF